MDIALDFIKSKIQNTVPDVAIVLGSGLGDFTSGLSGTTVSYSEIPGMAESCVQGHKGSFFFYKNIAVMQGRLHLYEGHSVKDVVFPIKLLKLLGTKKLILTNAAGAINKSFEPGDLVLINDHINLMGQNPLIGKNDDTLGVRFPDMSEVYSLRLRDIAKKCARKCKINLKEGVYAATTGPGYETPAEVRMLKAIGADVVGMSTVPEAIFAHWAGVEVLAFSLVSNYASGIACQKLSHSEVIEIGKITASKVKALLNSILEEI